MPNNCLDLFAGHTDPVFCIDWHFENKNMLASCSRDKTIKVSNPSHYLFNWRHLSVIIIVKYTPCLSESCVLFPVLTLSRPRLFRFLENNPNLDVIK